MPAICRQYVKRQQTPRISTGPLEKLYCILMPKLATLADVLVLREKAYQAAFIRNNLPWAEQLCIRAIAAANGRDIASLDLYAHIKRLQAQLFSGQEHRNHEQSSRFVTPPIPENIRPSQFANNGSETQRALKALRAASEEISKESQLLPLILANSSISGKGIRSQLPKWVLGFCLLAGLVALAFQMRPNGGSNPSNSDSRSWSRSDFNQLETLLEEQEWADADEETLNQLAAIVDRQEEGWLDCTSIRQLPCDALYYVDQLWANHSDGHFGFGAQARIYKRFGDEPVDPVDADVDNDTLSEDAEEADDRFGQEVDWMEDNDWIYSKDATFDLSAPQGHLPADSYRIGVEAPWTKATS